MKLNWMIFIVGFSVTFIITLFSGLYFPKMGLIGPVIGAFIAVYLVEVSYDNGIFYGGLPTSIAGFTSVPLIVFLSQNQATLQLAGLKISAGTLTAISGAISGFILFLFIGIICGNIAVAVRKKTNKKLVYALIAVFVIILVYILSNVVRVGAILCSFSGT